jgi:beta-lactamase class A
MLILKALSLGPMHGYGVGQRIMQMAEDMLREDQTSGSGFFQNYKPGAEVEFKELMHQMIAVSDNTATLMIMRWMGGTDVINDWLDRHGLKTTRLITPWPITKELERDEAAIQKIIELHKK